MDSFEWRAGFTWVSFYSWTKKKQRVDDPSVHLPCQSIKFLNRWSSSWTKANEIPFNSVFSERFGLYHVDFNSPKKTRTPKLSALNYAHIVKTHTIDWNFRPQLKHHIAAAPRLSDIDDLSYGEYAYGSSSLAIASPLLAAILAVLSQSYLRLLY